MTKEQQACLYKYLSEKIWSLDTNKIITAIKNYDNKWCNRRNDLMIRPYIEIASLSVDDSSLNIQGRSITLSYTDGEYTSKTYLDNGCAGKIFSVIIRDRNNICIFDATVSQLKDHILDNSFTISSSVILENQQYEVMKLSIDMMHYKINKFLNEECSPKDIGGFIERLSKANEELSKQS